MRAHRTLECRLRCDDEGLGLRFEAGEQLFTIDMSEDTVAHQRYLLLAREPHFTNRIHRDDAAGLLRHLISAGTAAELYLGVDCEPADEADVLRFLAEELGVALPRMRGAEDPPAVRRAGSKRCRSDRVRAAGYDYRYPSYREGYPAVVRAYLADRATAG